MAYGHDGQGLHRSSDPADDEDYVYGHLFLDAAPRVFACFDQPDLKAPYRVRVSTPRHWSVVGNGAAREESPGRWLLAATQPLATYFVTVCAGPWASVTAEHDGIPLGIHARRSLEPQLRAQAEHLLATTTTCFDHYHRLFGIRYPFGEYHQVFVPEFNAGAMENPGCVTVRDTYLFRGAMTPDQVFVRDNTIAHEMAHMWFGDLVTMRWWDDLWLNESFAEYMAYRAMVEAMGARRGVGRVRHRAQAVGLRRRALAEHAPGGRLAGAGRDLGPRRTSTASPTPREPRSCASSSPTSATRRSSPGSAPTCGRTPSPTASSPSSSGPWRSPPASRSGPWSEAWLRTAGADRLALDRAGTLTRTPPPGHPADRPHTLDVAAFDDDGAEVLRAEVFVHGQPVHVEGVAELAPGALLVPNASDLTWAEVALDDATLAALPGRLAAVPDATARQVLWTAVLGGLHRGEVDPRLVLDLVERAWPAEDDAAVLSRVGTVVADELVPRFLPPAGGGRRRRAGRRRRRPARRARPRGRGRRRRGARRRRRPGLGPARHRRGAAAPLGRRRGPALPARR